MKISELFENQNSVYVELEQAKGDMGDDRGVRALVFTDVPRKKVLDIVEASKLETVLKWLRQHKYPSPRNLKEFKNSMKGR